MIAASENPLGRGAWVLAMSLVVSVGSVLIALSQGSVDISLDEMVRVLTRPGQEPLLETILWDIRAPRVLTAYSVGAMLSVAGFLMQTLLRNPLADPYILGISGGAAAAALFSVVLTGSAAYLNLAAGLGALATTLVIGACGLWLFGMRGEFLLLCGIMLSAIWGAVNNILLSLGQGATQQSMLFWLMGDLSTATPPMITLALALGIILLCALSYPKLHFLMFTDAQAAAFGIPLLRWRLVAFVGASALTGLAVSLCGPLGFVGLIIPHACRLLLRHAGMLMIPACALLGGAFLTTVDVLCRGLEALNSLPVGAVCALFGAPLFIILLIRHRRGNITV